MDSLLMQRDDRASRARGRVLIVDDAAVVRLSMRRLLESAGYLVEAAEDGLSALALLESADFDVVVTDLRMPNLDGFGVLERVKAQQLLTEVIILTGTLAGDIGAALRALRLGAHDFLTKPPAAPEEVIMTVERAVEKKRLVESNRRLMRELEALSRTDALTGLLNRRALDEHLERERARAQRHGLALSLALLDIDNFKPINDTYGHAVGDKLLRAFADHLSRLVRDGDSVYRHGGDEFAMLLPHTPAPGALDALHRVVKAVAHACFDLDGLRLQVTVSAGVASLPCAPAHDLFAAADAALYDAKRAGRNRVAS
jgi:diguanylate cyclase (GGDEF)-like protein